MDNPKWGQFARRVCWLVGPSAVDVDLPHDHTLMYTLSDPYQGMGRPPIPILQTIDREEAAAASIAMYKIMRPHNLTTSWVNPQGKWVKKWDVIREARGLPPKQPKDEYGYL